MEHYNRKTEQCDPSVERLATMLGIGTASVQRATNELCSEAHGMFKREHHGGRNRRSSYKPCWPKYAAIVADWEARMVSGEAPATVSKVIGSQYQNRYLDTIRSDTLTQRRNPDKEPLRRVTGKNRSSGSGRSGIAHEAATRRLQRQIADLEKPVKQAAWELDQEVWETAIAAEIRRRGSGLRMLLDAIALSGSASK